MTPLFKIYTTCLISLCLVSAGPGWADDQVFPAPQEPVATPGVLPSPAIPGGPRRSPISLSLDAGLGLDPTWPIGVLSVGTSVDVVLGHFILDFESDLYPAIFPASSTTLTPWGTFQLGFGRLYAGKMALLWQGGGTTYSSAQRVMVAPNFGFSIGLRMFSHTDASNAGADYRFGYRTSVGARCIIGIPLKTEDLYFVFIRFGIGVGIQP